MEKRQKGDPASGCAYAAGAEQTPRPGGDGGTRRPLRGRGVPRSRGRPSRGEGGSRGEQPLRLRYGAALSPACVRRIVKLQLERRHVKAIY